MLINEDFLPKQPIKYKILYNQQNSGGTRGTVSLDDSVANYDYIDIAYRCSDGNYYNGCMRIYSPNGKIFYLGRAEANYNSSANRFEAYNVGKYYQIQNNQITVDKNSVAYNITQGTGSYYDNYYIIMVVGYKF